jgi:hypothetical protein
VILSTVVFALEAAAIVALVILGRRDDERFVPAAHLLDRVMATRPARMGILMFWWWLGWHFLVVRTVDP